MNVLLIGGGGREHAIAEAIKRSRHDVKLYTAMSKRNPGIARLSEDVLLMKETEVERIKDYVLEKGIELCFIGPEAPLAAGMTDQLEAGGVRVFGPTLDAARIEFDKAWTRNFMQEHKIKGNPHFKVFDRSQLREAHEFIDLLGDVVVKPAGLTGGKGVRVMGDHFRTLDDAKEYTDLVLEKDDVVIEERLVGEEFTLQAFSDGTHLSFAPAVQDHKRAYDGDRGPNTGGMGSYSDVGETLPFMNYYDLDAAREIMQETIDALKADGIIYKGLLYGQFMLTREGPKVIEFNARFGDPEAMNTLPLLNTDIIDIAEHVTTGKLNELDVSFKERASVCKYLVPEGYPEDPVTDTEIRITEPLGDALLFYSSVYEKDGKVYTTSSRAIALVGIAENIIEAEAIVEEAMHAIKGSLHARHDIGTEQLLQQRIDHMNQVRGR